MSEPTIVRRTRGPRTPGERAVDAAQSTATLFEKLPPSHFADEILKPIAVLLRFEVGYGYLEPGPRLRDVRRFDELERIVLDLAQELGRVCEHMPVRKAVEVGAMIENVRGDLRRQKGRIAAAFEGGDDDA